jgi:hypothetical protein
MRLVFVLSSRMLMSVVGVVEPGVIVIVGMDRAQMFEFSTWSTLGVMGHMYVLMIVEQPFVPVTLKALNHRKTPPSTRPKLPVPNAPTTASTKAIAPWDLLSSPCNLSPRIKGCDVPSGGEAVGHLAQMVAVASSAVSAAEQHEAGSRWRGAAGSSPNPA